MGWRRNIKRSGKWKNYTHAWEKLNFLGTTWIGPIEFYSVMCKIFERIMNYPYSSVIIIANNNNIVICGSWKKKILIYRETINIRPKQEWGFNTSFGSANNASSIIQYINTRIRYNNILTCQYWLFDNNNKKKNEFPVEINIIRQSERTKYSTCLKHKIR